MTAQKTLVQIPVLPEVAEQLVNVQWNDSWSGGAHWESRSDVDIVFAPISTVGFLVAKNETWIAIAQSISEDQYGNVQRIPVGCVVEVTVLNTSLPVSKKNG